MAQSGFGTMNNKTKNKIRAVSEQYYRKKSGLFKNLVSKYWMSYSEKNKENYFIWSGRRLLTVCLQETWLKAEKKTDNDIQIDGYSVYGRDRSEGEYGSILIYVHLGI